MPHFEPNIIDISIMGSILPTVIEPPNGALIVGKMLRTVAKAVIMALSVSFFTKNLSFFMLCYSFQNKLNILAKEFLEKIKRLRITEP